MIDECLMLAKHAALAAGEFLLKRQDVHIDASYDHDIKLSSDIESERIIVDSLRPSGLPVLSEECGLIGERSGFHWIVDPLDGTVNYYKGIDDLCCISIALYDGNEPVFGVINRFAADEFYIGHEDVGAQCNKEPVRPSNAKTLYEAVLATGFPSGMDYSENSIMQLIKHVRCAKKVRMLGSAALMATLVACGKIDAYFEQDINLWDIAAAAAIVQAAGGVTNITYKAEAYKCDFGAFSTKELMKEFYGT